MNYIYRVAYLAKDGGTFHGLPYLFNDAFSDIEDARKIKDWLNEIGFKGVEIFKVPYIPDEITWGYVEDNKVE